jgi:hypothetical protein
MQFPLRLERGEGQGEVSKITPMQYLEIQKARSNQISLAQHRASDFMKILAQWDQDFANALQEKCPKSERNRAGVFLSVIPNRQIWNEFLATA